MPRNPEKQIGFLLRAIPRTYLTAIGVFAFAQYFPRRQPSFRGGRGRGYCPAQVSLKAGA